ncbi:LacI family DNA-binding transcriptional regulator [Roseobacter sp. EG26]|uniref:LacI family DNA-binding transcriptional regulator n=1 Tax=Roseobacter sp. EG26 TaxID=3412477 RepID=UPI0026091D12|nr:LacI family DNA-binding transcriptional regulator [uncultured Roseobacter sp.]
MDRPPTMKDVARAAGVSVMTVSRAFKSDRSVSQQTREKVREIAEKMGYVFDSTAANLRSQKSGFIAVTIPTIDNGNFSDTVGSLSAHLNASGLQILLGYSDYSIEKEEELIEQLLRRRPEAIVVTGGRHTERTRRLLKQAGIPVVEMWDLPTDPIDHVVGFSNASTMEMMVDHLVEQGYQRIAFVGGDTVWDTRGADRRRGFVTGMARHGLSGQARFIAGGKPPISMRQGADAMTELLEQYPDTEAVICVSDPAAFGATTECMRRGLVIPQDMAVAGFGGYELSSISHPTITTVDPRPMDIGSQTAKLISFLLNSAERHEGSKRVEISPVLRPGASTMR